MKIVFLIILIFSFIGCASSRQSGMEQDALKNEIQDLRSRFDDMNGKLQYQEKLTKELAKTYLWIMDHIKDQDNKLLVLEIAMEQLQKTLSDLENAGGRERTRRKR